MEMILLHETVLLRHWICQFWALILAFACKMAHTWLISSQQHIAIVSCHSTIGKN